MTTNPTTFIVGVAKVSFKLKPWYNRGWPAKLIAMRWVREIRIPSSTYDNGMWLSGWEPVKGVTLTTNELADLGGKANQGIGVTSQDIENAKAKAKQLSKVEERHKKWIAKGNLHAGIYGVVFGRKSRKFSIKPYQLRKRTFWADKVERISSETQTQNIGCDSKPLLLNVKGYDAILFGLGDD